jgi:hypothetical protein
LNAGRRGYLFYRADENYTLSLRDAGLFGVYIIRLLSWVPGFDGYLKNGNGSAGLQPATGGALAV